MRFDIITIFPEMFQGAFEHGIIRRAQEHGIVEICLHDLREFTSDKHRTVDDRPFGGGEGMVVKPEPVFRAVESIVGESMDRQQVAVILLSPQGVSLTQSVAERLSRLQRMILICGRYEGVDERVADYLVTEEISIGDYVLTGGEIPAMVLVDALTRLQPEALGRETSAQKDSFSSADSPILDCPHYTRPADFRGLTVPEVLLSGDHAEIARWRRRKALEKTLKYRPDLLERATLSGEDLRTIEELKRDLHNEGKYR